MRTTTYAAPYVLSGGQDCSIATLWDDNGIVGQVPLVLAKPRVSWLPYWLPFNCAPTSELEALGLFALVKKRWEQDGYVGFIPKWLKGYP